MNAATNSTCRPSSRRARTAALTAGIAALSSLTQALAGCGDPGFDEDVRTGRLVGAVSGVTFETSTMDGTTDADGTFRYREGEKVRFRLGATVLGEADGRVELTAFDLAGIEPITDGKQGVEAVGTAFDRVANILVLFDSFDYDGDPSNGIEITDAVRQVLETEPMDLDRDYWSFRTDRVFREVLNQANDEGVLLDHRAPRGPIPPLNRLYEHLGIESGLFGIVARTSDTDNDGVIDERSEYEYDSDGNRSYVRFEDRVGPAYTLRTEYDSWGNFTFDERDTDIDGTIDEVTQYIQDADGNFVRSERDLNNDGRPDRISIREFDERGRRTSYRLDTNGDGIDDSIELTDYDDESRTETLREDSNGDGVIDYILLTEYTVDDRIAVERIDNNGDGVFDQEYASDYDDEGREIGAFEDSDGDGRYDRIVSYHYGASGLEMRRTDDHNGDGIVDRVIHYYYDADDRIIRSETDRNNDGTIDDLTSYSYSDVGTPYGVRSRTTSIDRGFDGTIDSETFEYYDRHGLVVRRTRDSDGDGDMDSVDELTHAPIGWGDFIN